MQRVTILTCVALWAASSAAVATEPGKKLAAGKDGAQSALAKHGLSEFDTDGDGRLDQSERAAAVTAKRAARKEALAKSAPVSGPYYAAASYPMLARPRYHMTHHGFNPSNYHNFPTGAGYQTTVMQGPFTADIGYCPKSKQDETVTFSPGPPGQMPGFGN
jgi:hypothetical protein